MNLFKVMAVLGNSETGEVVFSDKPRSDINSYASASVILQKYQSLCTEDSRFAFLEMVSKIDEIVTAFQEFHKNFNLKSSVARLMVRNLKTVMTEVIDSGIIETKDEICELLLEKLLDSDLTTLDIRMSWPIFRPIFEMLDVHDLQALSDTLGCGYQPLTRNSNEVDIEDVILNFDPNDWDDYSERLIQFTEGDGNLDPLQRAFNNFQLKYNSADNPMLPTGDFFIDVKKNVELFIKKYIDKKFVFPNKPSKSFTPVPLEVFLNAAYDKKDQVITQVIEQGNFSAYSDRFNELVSSDPDFDHYLEGMDYAREFEVQYNNNEAGRKRREQKQPAKESHLNEASKLFLDPKIAKLCEAFVGGKQGSALLMTQTSGEPDRKYGFVSSNSKGVEKSPNRRLFEPATPRVGFGDDINKPDLYESGRNTRRLSEEQNSFTPRETPKDRLDALKVLMEEPLSMANKRCPNGLTDDALKELSAELLVVSQTVKNTLMTQENGQAVRADEVESEQIDRRVISMFFEYYATVIADAPVYVPVLYAMVTLIRDWFFYEKFSLKDGLNGLLNTYFSFTISSELENIKDVFEKCDLVTQTEHRQFFYNLEREIRMILKTSAASKSSPGTNQRVIEESRGASGSGVDNEAGSTKLTDTSLLASFMCDGDDPDLGKFEGSFSVSWETYSAGSS